MTDEVKFMTKEEAEEFRKEQALNAQERAVALNEFRKRFKEAANDRKKDAAPRLARLFEDLCKTLDRLDNVKGEALEKRNEALAKHLEDIEKNKDNGAELRKLAKDYSTGIDNTFERLDRTISNYLEETQPKRYAAVVNMQDVCCRSKKPTEIPQAKKALEFMRKDCTLYQSPVARRYMQIQFLKLELEEYYADMGAVEKASYIVNRICDDAQNVVANLLYCSQRGLSQTNVDGDTRLDCVKREFDKRVEHAKKMLEDKAGFNHYKNYIFYVLDRWLMLAQAYLVMNDDDSLLDSPPEITKVFWKTMMEEKMKDDPKYVEPEIACELFGDVEIHTPDPTPEPEPTPEPDHTPEPTPDPDPDPTPEPEPEQEQEQEESVIPDLASDDCATYALSELKQGRVPWRNKSGERPTPKINLHVGCIAEVDVLVAEALEKNNCLLTPDRKEMAIEIAGSILSQLNGFDDSYGGYTGERQEREDAAKWLALGTQGDHRHNVEGFALRRVLRHAAKAIETVVESCKQEQKSEPDPTPEPTPETKVETKLATVRDALKHEANERYGEDWVRRHVAFG